MGVGIFAPVPAVHMKSALDICAKEGKVSFGTNAWEVFVKASTQYGEGIPVRSTRVHKRATRMVWAHLER